MADLPLFDYAQLRSGRLAAPDEVIDNNVCKTR